MYSSYHLLIYYTLVPEDITFNIQVHITAVSLFTFVYAENELPAVTECLKLDAHTVLMVKKSISGHNLKTLE